MRVCILQDHPQWAQALHANGLKKYAPKGIDVEVMMLGEKPRGFDAVYCINFASVQPFPGSFVSTCLASHAWMHPRNNENDWSTRGVNNNRNSSIAIGVIRRPNAIVCRNTALQKWASGFHGKAKCIPAGVDTELFTPRGRSFGHRKIRVGWSGQVNPDLRGRFKGYDEIWLPLKERLSGRYEFVENTRTAEEALSWQEMAEWYRSIDVFLCTATAEGTPNGPFCAAACGCAIISTDVGQVSDWSVLRDMGLIVPTYRNPQESEVTISEIQKHLSRLEDSLTLSAVMYETYNSILESYSYSVLAKQTLEFVSGVSS